MPNKAPNHIVISRTDSIGDVMLTLPVAGVLKQHFPGTRISFLGKNYTRPVIEACAAVDHFIELDEFLQGRLPEAPAPDVIIHVFPNKAVARKAKQMKIAARIGTTNRLFHWTTCNRLVRLSRKNSPLHEAQLNLKLLEPLGLRTDYTLAELPDYYSFSPRQSPPPALAQLIDPSRYNLILHPRSQGSAREWGLDRFAALVQLLPPEQFNIFVSGTAKERTLLDPLMDAAGDRVTDITGQMSLSEFIAFIDRCDGLVANSTGPLHIAAALGKDALGIYPPIRPMHPGRWAPLGKKARVFVLDKNCEDCRSKPSSCHCIRAIEASAVALHLQHGAGS